ncbi:hypothetical protein Fot_03643 [Forsythia ovata]|uniref:Uncharacterized protein n=1 Tax=Forsythia ovata TaxID=205694 RepID=A0ABD1XAF3_9LAMI
MAPNPASSVPPVVETVGNVSFSFPTSSTTPVLAAIVLSIVEVGDDSSFLPPRRRSWGDSSSLPLVLEVRDDLSSLPSKISTSPPVDVQHQDKGKGVVIDEMEKVATKMSLEEEGAVVDSGRVKGSRMALTQEISESVPTSPIAVQNPLLNSFD